MYSLLLDSSNTNLSVGLAKEHQLIDETSYEAWQRQSEMMVEEIDKLLKKNHVSRNDLSSVVVSKGPGSYTGVRIALSIAKTVSFALNIPLYLVSSLKAMEEENAPTICLMNARSKRSYIGVYEGDKCLLEDTIFDNDKVLDYINKNPGYAVSGDLSYLGIEGKHVNILANLAKQDIEMNLEKEPLGARPVYLKDSYSASELKITVREMNSSDIFNVMEIENASFAHPYLEKQIRYDLLENPVGHIYVAIVDSSIVGFIDFMITFDSSCINQIAVTEKFRKRGIGSRLLGKMLDVLASQTEEVDFSTLEVRKSNVEAHKFYKKHLYQDVTVKEKYYEDGEDAIYMVRSLING